MSPKESMVAQGLWGLKWCRVTALRSEENAKNRGGLKTLQAALGVPQRRDGERSGRGKNESNGACYSISKKAESHLKYMWEFIPINTMIIRVKKLFLFFRREGQGRILSGFKNTLVVLWLHRYRVQRFRILRRAHYIKTEFSCVVFLCHCFSQVDIKNTHYFSWEKFNPSGYRLVHGNRILCRKYSWYITENGWKNGIF